MRLYSTMHRNRWTTAAKPVFSEELTQAKKHPHRREIPSPVVYPISMVRSSTPSRFCCRGVLTVYAAFEEGWSRVPVAIPSVIPGEPQGAERQDSLHARNAPDRRLIAAAPGYS